MASFLKRVLRASIVRHLFRRPGVWFFMLPGLAASQLAAAASTASQLEYNRDVRPILSENCFACHGADSAARKGGLRLDRRDDAIAAKAIIPGKPAESALIARILTQDAEERMPPARSHKILT